MPNLPSRVSSGAQLSANWLNRLLDWCRGAELKAGPGIKLSRTPSGTTISAPRRGSDGAGGDEWPAVFTVKWSNGEAWMWLPLCDDFGPNKYVMLNGSFAGVSASGISGSRTGWVPVGIHGTYFLLASFSTRKVNDQWEARVSISLTTSAGTSSDTALYVPIAHVTQDGKVYQLHDGILPLVWGVSTETTSYSSIFYDAENSQIRAAKTTKTYANGVCIQVEDGQGGENEDILLYIGECDCDDSQGVP